MYKMVAIDIDGTLINQNRALTSVVKKRIADLQAIDVKVCLNTGRSLKNTAHIHRALKLKTPIICMDGAIIYDPLTENFLYNNALNLPDKTIAEPNLDYEKTRKMLEILFNHHVYVEVATNKRYFRHVKVPELRLYLFGGDSFGVLHNYKEHMWGVRHMKSPEHFLSTLNTYNYYQLMVGGSEEELSKVTNAIQNLGYDDVLIHDELWEGYIFVQPHRNSKAYALEFLCNMYDYSMDEVIAIGDEHNDLSMIKSAGMGIAMGNAIQSVKDVANHITLSNNEDGVAKAIEKFFNLT